MNKTPIFLRAALCASAIFGATMSAAQEGYDPMRPAGNPLVPGTSAQTPAAPAAAPDPELGNLPAGPGAEETYYQCVACHSTAIIRQQRLTDERWDYLWTWMVEEQGMFEPDEETRQLILTYLKTHFSSER
ncbi:MAG: cytochrome C-552 [Roseovarius sp.]|nr:cytochrome C-552 [Roseovarius sp.]